MGKNFPWPLLGHSCRTLEPDEGEGGRGVSSGTTSCTKARAGLLAALVLAKACVQPEALQDSLRPSTRETV